jgi:hypothetical protein
MTKIQEILIKAYTTLVLAEKKTIEEVPTTPVVLPDNTESTIRQEVDIKVAEKTIEILG